METTRRVSLPPDFRPEDYQDYQVNYMNYHTGWLIPGTDLWIGDKRWLRINAHGCKGEDLDPQLGTIAIFGDSTAFGTGRDCWPSHVRVPGYQVLNAAIEGHNYERMVERYLDLSPRLSLDAVVISGGWHNLVYNDFGEYAWASFLSRFETARLLAVCTLATSFTSEGIDRGTDDLIAGRAGRKPYASGGWPTAPGKAREVYDALLRYNDFVRRYCERTGAILIDLFNVYRPESYRAMPDMFMDPSHPLPALYPALARRLADALAPRLPARTEQGEHGLAGMTGTPASPVRGRRLLPGRMSAWIDGVRAGRPTRATAPTDRIRRVRYPEGAQFPALQDFQINYFNNRTRRLIPNTEVWVGAERWLKINALGCKGEDVDPKAPTIGFFGDSTVWGGGPDRHKTDAWPLHVDVPGYQVLNGGVERAGLPIIEQRYEELREAVNMPAVVLGGSWQIVAEGERQWRMFFDAFRRGHLLAICSLPTALTQECGERGLDPLVRGEHAAAERFRPWKTETTPETTASLFDAVLRYNEFVRAYCAETGSVLIDLFHAYRPEDYAHVPVMFRDPIHPRYPLYPTLGRCASGALAGALGMTAAERAA